ncbi:COG3152 Predicted membrane protein [Candidatus Nanopelagicaceae bacterium]
MPNFFETNAVTLNKAFTINGTSSRREYWYFILFTWLATAISLVIDHLIGGDMVYNIVNILLFVPTLTAAIRRMHDSNHRGWWLLFPVVNFILLVSPTVPNRWTKAE